MVQNKLHANAIAIHLVRYYNDWLGGISKDEPVLVVSKIQILLIDNWPIYSGRMFPTWHQDDVDQMIKEEVIVAAPEMKRGLTYRESRKIFGNVYRIKHCVGGQVVKSPVS